MHYLNRVPMFLAIPFLAVGTVFAWWLGKGDWDYGDR